MIAFVVCAPDLTTAEPFSKVARSHKSESTAGGLDRLAHHGFDRSLEAIRPKILRTQQTLPYFTVQDVQGSPGAQLPIVMHIPPEVGQSGQPVQGRTFIMLRGLPEDFTLSAGFRTRNAWVVSLPDAQRLSMTSPINYRGNFSLDILLFYGEGTLPESRRVTVSINPMTATADAASTKPMAALARSGPLVEDQSAIIGRAEPKPKLPAPVPALDAAEESASLQRAQDLMDQGNVASARMLYEDLASRGSANGAYAMGRSFDPEVLAKIRVMGLTPDLEQARHWYRKAAVLGSHSAEERLSALNNSR